MQPQVLLNSQLPLKLFSKGKVRDTYDLGDSLLMVTTDRDQALIAIDQRIFGFQASMVLQKIISPRMTAYMNFAYFFHVINIPLVACFIYVWRPRPRFREMMSGPLPGPA